MQLNEHIILSRSREEGRVEAPVNTSVTNVFFTHFTLVHPSLCPPLALLLKQEPVEATNTPVTINQDAFYSLLGRADSAGQ